MSEPAVLVERHHIRRTHASWSACDLLCFASKNLYNACLYSLRQQLFGTKTWLLREEVVSRKNAKTGEVEGRTVKRWAFSSVELYHRFKNTPEFRTAEHPELGKAINTKVLKQTFRQVGQDVSNFFSAQQAFQINPGSFSGRPRLPGYKTAGEKGRTVCTVPIEALSFKPEKDEGGTPTGRQLVRVGMADIVLPTSLKKSQVLELKIVPCTNGYDAIFSYTTLGKADWKQHKAAQKSASRTKRQSPQLGCAPLSTVKDGVASFYKGEDGRGPTEKTGKSEETEGEVEAMERLRQPGVRLASGDLGVVNLLVLTSNDPGITPIIVEGNQVRHTNQVFNEAMAKTQRGLCAQAMKGRHGETIKAGKVRLVAEVEASLRSQGKAESEWAAIIGRALERKYGLESYASHRTRTLWQDRKHAFDSAFHLISRRVVEWCQRHRIEVFVLGYNEGWKTAVNMGRANNRRFVQIPFARLAHMLSYKLAQAGIAFLKHEESYTSKCSFLDKEPICKHSVYAGNRVHRGLFRSSTGKLIHADVQGSLNVGRKVSGDSAYQQWFAPSPVLLKGLAVAPVRVKFI